MSEKTARLAGLDAIRGFGIILVVGIHAMGYAFPKDKPGAPVMNSFLNEFIGIAVPLFYMVDGYLTTRSQSKLVPPRFSEILRKSSRRLLVPWLIFNVIYVGFRAFTEWRGIVEVRLLVGQPFSVVFHSIWYSNIASQLYFLPTLFLMRLLAHPCRFFFTGPVWRLVLFGLAYVGIMRGVGLTLLEGNPISHAIVEFPYFIFGAIVYRLDTSADRRGMKILGLVGLIAIAQRFVPWPEAVQGVSFNVVKFGMCLAVYLASNALANARLPFVWLGGRTMEIYLLHSPILIRVVGMVAAKLFGMNWTRYAFVWSVTLAATIALTLVLARIPQSKRLFGES